MSRRGSGVGLAAAAAAAGQRGAAHVQAEGVLPPHRQLPTIQHSSQSLLIAPQARLGAGERPLRAFQRRSGPEARRRCVGTRTSSRLSLASIQGRRRGRRRSERGKRAPRPAPATADPAALCRASQPPSQAWRTTRATRAARDRRPRMASAPPAAARRRWTLRSVRTTPLAPSLSRPTSGWWVLAGGRGGGRLGPGQGCRPARQRELCRGSGPDPLDTFAVGCTCTALPALWDRSGLPAPLQATSIHYCLLQIQVESIPIQGCIDGQRRAATGANNRSGYRGVRRVSAEGCGRRMMSCLGLVCTYSVSRWL